MLNPQASSFHPSMIDPIVSSLNDSTEVVPSKNNSSAKSSRKSQKKKNPGTQLKSTAVNESPAESSTPSHIHDSNQLNPTKNYGPKTTSRRREVKGDQKEPNGSNQNVNCDDRKALDLTRVGYQEDNKKNPDHCSNEEIKGDSRGRGSNSKPGKLKNAIANEAQKSDLPSASTFNCDICTSPSEFIAFGSCNHPICTLCSLRMRSKSKDLTCAICKCKLDFVIVCSTSSTSLTKAIDFDSFGIQYFDDQLSYVKRFSTVDLDHRALMLFGDCKVCRKKTS